MKKLVFLILIDLFLFSCKPDKSCSREDEITYENIPDSNISQIPYKGDELLSFVNQTGDTAVFKCTGYNNYYEQSYYWNGNADCSWKSITKTQQIDFTFIDTANENRNFRVKYSMTIPNGPKSFRVLFFLPKENYLTGAVMEAFDNPIYIDTIETKFGSKLLGTYLGVAQNVFYNKHTGINLFTDQFQNKWTILN